MRRTTPEEVAARLQKTHEEFRTALGSTRISLVAPSVGDGTVGWVGLWSTESGSLTFLDIAWPRPPPLVSLRLPPSPVPDWCVIVRSEVAESLTAESPSEFAETYWPIITQFSGDPLLPIGYWDPGGSVTQLGVSAAVLASSGAPVRCFSLAVDGAPEAPTPLQATTVTVACWNIEPSGFELTTLGPEQVADMPFLFDLHLEDRRRARTSPPEPG